MPKEIDYLNLDIRALKEMRFRDLFVRFEREEHSTIVNVLLDGCHLDYIYSAAMTLEEFASDCNEYLASDKYEEAKMNFYKKETASV